MDIINVKINGKNKLYNSYTDIINDLYYNLGIINDQVIIDKISSNIDLKTRHF